MSYIYSESELEVKDMQEIYMEITLKLQDLSNEELVAEYQKTNNEEYLKMLMVRNKGIIYTIASSYSIEGYNLDDLFEEGFVALWKAADNFNSSRGYTFTTCLKGFVKQTYNRLYTKAHTASRGGGESSLSWEELEEIHKEQAYTDDYSSVVMEELLDRLNCYSSVSISFVLISICVMSRFLRNNFAFFVKFKGVFEILVIRNEISINQEILSVVWAVFKYCS